MKRIKRKEVFKLDHYSLQREAGNRWKVSGRNSCGKYRRLRFSAYDLTEAIAQADKLLFGREVQSKDPETIQLHEAFSQWIGGLTISATTRQDYLDSIVRFCDWAENKGIVFWIDLKFAHVRNYLAKLVQEKKSQRTLMHRLHPLRGTSGLMAANHPEVFHDICKALRLPRNKVFQTQYRETEGNPVLLIADVLAFLEWLKSHPKRIELKPGVALQGLCGLQMQEALRLTWDKVDLNERSIVIDGVVKNQWRIRKIPIPDYAADVLRLHRDAYDPDEHRLFPFYRGDYRDYSKWLHAALHAWRPGIDLAPKDLRNTLVTESFQRGWNTYLMERYVGHAPRTIAERHYFGNKGERLFDLHLSELITPCNKVVENARKLHDSSMIIEMCGKTG